jgi:rubrerythrin
VSRIPRAQEYLKTGFTAEAASAARFRAYADRAKRDGLPNLAEHWLDLAVGKDELATRQLEAAEQVRGSLHDLSAAIAEEQYENEVLYSKMIADSDPETAEILRGVVTAQREHLQRMQDLREALTASTADVPAKLGTLAAS